MKKLWFVPLLFFHLILQAQPASDFKVLPDGEDSLLVGRVTAENIWTYFPEWKADYIIAEPDSAVVSALQSIEESYHIIVVFGTWCPDSRTGLPPFLKALDLADNADLKLTLYAVDRRLHDPEKSAKEYGVERVPTFIVLKNGQEVGRMIEFPEENFESDLIKLLRQNKKRKVE
ncbi:MAG: thioredoxin family protein [Calditrichia bacterium]